jgi:hypothetical protein
VRNDPFHYIRISFILMMNSLKFANEGSRKGTVLRGKLAKELTNICQVDTAVEISYCQCRLSPKPCIYVPRMP